MTSDVLIEVNGPVASVTGETEEGIDFVESWLLGVLSVLDAGRISITSEAINDFRHAAAMRGITVQV